MDTPASLARAYRGPYLIRSHRTLAELGFGEPAGPRPVVIGLDLGRSPDIHVEQVVQVTDGRHRVIGQRFRSVADDQPREDPRKLQAQWDEEAREAIRAQFLAVNDAKRRTKFDRAPSVVALAIGIGSAIAGAALIGAVVLYFAVVLRLIGGQ